MRNRTSFTSSRISYLFYVFPALLLLAVPANAERTTVKVFKIAYADVYSLKETLKVVLSKEGKISVDARSHSIVVVDYPRVITKVQKLLAQLDKRPKNIRIKVDFVETSKLKTFLADIKWRVKGNEWTVGMIPSSGEGSGLDLTAGVFSSHSKKSQFLLILENRTGRIFVGQEVPFTDYFMQYGYMYGYIGQKVHFKKAGTSFMVTARTTGKGKIYLTLEPEVSYYDRTKKSFNVKNAATTVVVDDPGTVVIGSLNDQSDSFSSNFFRGVDTT
ncbi:MAG: type II secretion system protein GspD, partial [Patescibacteria group bacterium]